MHQITFDRIARNLHDDLISLEDANLLLDELRRLRVKDHQLRVMACELENDMRKRKSTEPDRFKVTLMIGVAVDMPLDDLHHAPACPANNWSGTIIPRGRCNCGAQLEWERTNAK